MNTTGMKMRIVDLSHSVNNQMASYWGGSVTNFTWSATFEAKGRCASKLEMSAHTATHIDAPLHFIPDGIPIDAVPVSRLVGNARLVNLRQVPREKNLIDPQAFSIAANRLQKDEIVILYTGIWQDFGKERFTTEMPVLAEESVEWLLSKQVRAIGLDCISVDPLKDPQQPNHKRILGAGVPIIEGLANLDQIEEDLVFLVALPLKLAGREAAPARVIVIEGIS